MDPITGAIISAGADLLGGLFSDKPPSAGDNVLSQVGGVMQASEQFGINPLTILGSTAANGGQGGTSAPLSSVGAMTSALLDVASVDKKHADKNAEMNELKADLGAIAIDQTNSGLGKTFKSGVMPDASGYQFRTSASNAVGTTTNVVGPRAATLVPPGTAPGTGGPGTFKSAPAPYAPTRKKDDMPVINDPGFLEVQFGDNVWAVPAINGEVPDVDQYPLLAGSFIYDHMKDNLAKIDKTVPPKGPQFNLDLNGGKPVAKDKQRDLRRWPFDGLNPFDNAYQKEY